MKQQLFLFGIMFLGLSCQEEVVTDAQEETCFGESSMNNSLKENFTVDFSLDENNSIVATIIPGEGAYFGSPKSKDMLNGYANLVVDENEFIHVDDGFIEYPESEKVYDSFSQGYINWVHDKTSYTYGTCRRTEVDFEVKGNLSFVIEPECSRYEIGFKLINKDGELSIEKMKTEIHNLSN